MWSSSVTDTAFHSQDKGTKINTSFLLNEKLPLHKRIGMYRYVLKNNERYPFQQNIYHFPLALLKSQCLKKPNKSKPSSRTPAI